MLGCQPADGFIIGKDIGDAAALVIPSAATAQANHRLGDSLHRLGHTAVVEIDDQAIAIPFVQVGDPLVLDFLDEHRPIPPFAHVGRDS